MIVPWQQLSPEALAGVIEEFVTRDGTDTAEMAAKSVTVRRQLEQERVVLVFDPETESCTIVAKEDVPDE